MQIKIQNLIGKFSDIRFAGQVVFVIIAIMITWSGVKSVQSNYVLQKQISGLKQQNTVAQLQNDNLKLQNEYYNTNQYLDISARQNFGLALPGETEIVVPKSVAMSHTVNTSTKQNLTPTKLNTPVYQKNLTAWWNFFLNKN